MKDLSAHIKFHILQNNGRKVICVSYNMYLSNKHVDNSLLAGKRGKILLVQCTSCVNF